MYERFKQLGKDSIIYGIGTTVSKALNFILIPIYTRVFSAEIYGVLDILIVSTVFIVILADMGLSAALSMFYYQAKDEGERKTVVTSNFLLLVLNTLLIVVLVILFSGELSQVLFKSEVYAGYLVIAAIVIFFTTILNFGATIYRLAFKPFHFFYITLGNVVLSVILSIYFVIFLKMGLNGALYGLLYSAMIFTAISLFLARKSFTFNISLEKLKEMLKVGLPLAPVGVGIWIMDYSSRYFLVQFQDLSQVGLYAVGYRLAGFLGLVVAGFRLANVPHQFSAAIDGAAKNFYSKTLTYYFLIGLFLVTALSIFSKEVLTIFATPEYIEGYRAILPLSFSFIFMGLYHMVGLGLILTKKTYFMSFGVLGAGVAAIVLNIYLVPQYGFFGAALANVIAYFLGLVLIYFWAQKYYHVDYENKKILKIGAATFLLIFLGLSLQTGLVILNIVLKLLLLVLFVLFTRFVLEKKEIEAVGVAFASFKRNLFKNKHEG